MVDPYEHRWIAKFPSERDTHDIGACQGELHVLSVRAGFTVPTGWAHLFGSAHHTFLSERFDRTRSGARLHFLSAMALLELKDDASAAKEANDLELADILIRPGARTAANLEELWPRVLFSVLVTNTDDHFHNHGFLLEPDRCALAPAYEVNPDPNGVGLKLSIFESDNSQELSLVMEVAPFFRITKSRAAVITFEVKEAERSWRDVATSFRLTPAAQHRMQRAFRIADQAG